MSIRPLTLSAAALAALGFVRPAPAATVYSNLQDLAIPTGFAGVYLDLDTGTTSTSAFTGWDINPFFGGTGIGNSAAFQPVRVGAGNLDRVLNLAPGTVVSSGLTFASGFGGSGNVGHEHLGAGADQFQVGTEGYLGFKFTKNGGTDVLNGWMRVTLTNNAAGAVIKDWGYDDQVGGAIAVGRVQQSAAVAGTQTVTLSPGNGENFTLGSALTNTGGNVNSLLKTGAGTTRLTGANTFTGSTLISAGTLTVGAADALKNTAAITVNNAGTLLLGGAGDRVSNSAGLTLAGGVLDAAGLSETFGALTLSADSRIDFGAGNSVLTFAAGNLNGHRLDLWNWTGTTVTGGGADQLRFLDAGGLASQLNLIHFFSNAGTTEISVSAATPFNTLLGPSGEVVPIPEPSGILAGMALLGLLGWRERRRILPPARSDGRRGAGCSPYAGDWMKTGYFGPAT